MTLANVADLKGVVTDGKVGSGFGRVDVAVVVDLSIADFNCGWIC